MACSGPTANTSRTARFRCASDGASSDADVLRSSARALAWHSVAGTTVFRSGSSWVSLLVRWRHCTGRSRRRRNPSMPGTPRTGASRSAPPPSGKGSSPRSMSPGIDRYASTAHALTVRNGIAGTPSSSATSTANGSTPSATTHVTGGNPSSGERPRHSGDESSAR
jgi:hypothetical protein